VFWKTHLTHKSGAAELSEQKWGRQGSPSNRVTKALVDAPDQVSVNSVEEDEDTILELTVGRTIWAR